MGTILGGQTTLILDGGLATHLEALGCDLSDELWSARLLLDCPHLIRQAHRDFFHAGADVAITASYQASLPAFQRRGIPAPQAEHLLKLSVELAAHARDEAGGGLIAASIGPYGASLANGAEYTGDYDLDTQALTDWHRRRWHILAESPADLLACETIPSHAEALALAELLAETPQTPAWISFTCRDSNHISDGTPLADAAAAFDHLPNVVAVGANCTAPRHITDLIGRLATRPDARPVVAYPNSGETWDAASRTWTGTANPAEFAAAAGEWHRTGAALIGGCCRTTPEHISQIRHTIPAHQSTR